VRARALTVAASMALLIGITGQASAAVDAPGIYEGPTVVSEGLLWAGNGGVSLSGAGGTRLLLADAESSTVQVEDGWTLAVEPAGLEIGRVGGSLEPIRRLIGCEPLGEDGAKGWRVAMGDDSLYAIVTAHCARRKPQDAQYVVRMRLGTEKVHVIGRVPAGAISLAAAGSRLALTYEEGEKPTGRISVEVRGTSDAKLLYTVKSPADQQPRDRDAHTEIDGGGDVLVTSTSFLPPGPAIAHGWWGNATTPNGRSLGETGHNVASLADGRIAYTTEQAGVEQIDVLDLASGTTRTLVTFPGSAEVEGVGLGSTQLAWAQQSFGFTPPTTSGFSCVSRVSAGPTELLETSLSAPGLPIVVDGATVAPAGAPPCPEM
jgi:hypothetical protein